mgnify:CR=1 FL=1
MYDILTLEKDIVNEISLLIELNCYPSVELALIRKDMKLFHEQKAQNEQQIAHMAKDTSSSGVRASSNPNIHSLIIDELTLEYKITEKKLIILHNKRLEETENKAIIERKMLKRAQKEAGDRQTNAKDKMNFKNQTRF